MSLNQVKTTKFWSVGLSSSSSVITSVMGNAPIGNKEIIFHEGH